MSMTFCLIAGLFVWAVFGALILEDALQEFGHDKGKRELMIAAVCGPVAFAAVLGHHLGGRKSK